MNFDLGTILLIAGLYLACLFTVAQITEKGLIPAKVTRHPLTYILSLGIIISTWSFYTALISASSRGYGYTAYYVGYAAAFLFAPIFLQPIFHITRTYQLNSLADLFSFRFRSPWAGTLTTLILIMCTVTLLGLQIRAVTASVNVLIPALDSRLFALAVCTALMIFTMRYGIGDLAARDQHVSVVTAMAFESVVKILILTALFLFAVYGVFGGFGALDKWLLEQTPETTRLELPFLGDNTNLTLVLFFTAAIAMPHMFHMVFHENNDAVNLRVARWGIPLLLLIASLPILPVLWASEYLHSEGNVQFASLAIGILANSPAITLMVFTGGFAATCGVVIVLAMSMSGMCVNHILLRLQKPKAKDNLYRWLALRKRLFIFVIMACGYGCYLLLEYGVSITDISYISFISCVQFLPGILALLYWPSGNRKGFIAGLVSGFLVWSLLGMLPVFTGLALSPLSYSATGAINWDMIASLALLTNMLMVIVVSLLTRTSDEERTSGEMCSMNTIRRPRPISLQTKTPLEFIEKLAAPLGRETAEREVREAMEVLNIHDDETRAYAMHQLRGQLEANLSGLLGPTIAHQIIDRFLPYQRLAGDTTPDIRYLENRLDSYPGNLSGVALDLDNLRKYHRKILQNIPVGVFSLDDALEITMWNSEMEKLTGLASDDIVGKSTSDLRSPWNELLGDFIDNEESTHVPKKMVEIDARRHWLSLHKTGIEKPGKKPAKGEGMVILVEDLTETEMLEAELTHAERLASIGRLAAGVAHEIGNPITGIACLAQNIRDETGDTDLRQMAEQIIAQTRRTSKIVETLMSFSHSGENGKLSQSKHTPKEPVSVYDNVAEAIQLISLDNQNRGINFVNACSPGVNVYGDKQRLQQIFVNLLTNARDASPPDSTISVTNSINDDLVSIMISDEGEGIPEHLQDRIFEPFFTTKDPGKGTGLGLALVYTIAENLGGTVRIESPADKLGKKGTRVIVTFPCYHDVPKTAPAAAEAS